ncbi:acid-activated periplasmic chaperone HdeA [Pseudomonas sp. NPDC086278]|uniref:acid-activated periplasmic chaperone HdeA n=1 Tax=Pseudomonas sp. NPDC086278 TaxID=3390646 RepID=UPI003D07BCC7
MNAKQVFVATLAILASSAVLAAKPPAKPVDKWTCGDFLEMDETYQPNAIFFAEGFTKSGKPVDAVMDVDGTLKVTPKVIEACTQNAQGSFVDTLKATKAKQ